MLNFLVANSEWKRDIEPLCLYCIRSIKHFIPKKDPMCNITHLYFNNPLEWLVAEHSHVKLAETVSVLVETQRHKAGFADST